MNSAEKKLRQLPRELQNEVEDFIDFLLAKKATGKKKRPNLNWMGGLKKYRDKYTSLELQEMAYHKPFFSRLIQQGNPVPHRNPILFHWGRSCLICIVASP
jgi:hypothetical protein